MTDQNIPADKVQEIIDMMDTRPTHPDGTSHHSEGYNEAVCLWNKHLRALLPATLADELREWGEKFGFCTIPNENSKTFRNFADRVETLEQERDEARELLGLREALIAEMKEEAEQDRVSSTAEIARLRAREIPDGWRVATHDHFGPVIAADTLDSGRHHCVFRSNVGPGISQTWASPKELRFHDETPAPEETPEPERIDPASFGRYRPYLVKINEREARAIRIDDDHRPWLSLGHGNYHSDSQVKVIRPLTSEEMDAR